MKKIKILSLLLCAGLLVACNDANNSTDSNSNSTGPNSQESVTSVNQPSSSVSGSEEDVIQRLVISKYPKRSYVIGEALSLAGLEVKLVTTKNGVTDNGVVYSLSNIVSNPEEGTILNQLGNQQVLLYSKEDSSIIETYFTILIDEKVIQQDVETRNLVVQSFPTKTNYYQGEAFETSGLIIAQEIYLNGIFQKREPVLDDEYRLLAEGNEIHDGDILEVYSPRYTINVESTKSTNDLIINGTSFNIVVEESEVYDPTLPSAIEMFTRLKNARNYTIKVTDAFRGMTLTKTYTEHAYFFDSEKTYFGHFGYAVANNQVFRFTIEDNEIVADIPYRINDIVVSDLYGSGVMTSFADMDLTNLPNNPVTGNSYRLDLTTNEENVLNLIDIINYGDGVMDLTDIQQIMISVTGQDTLRIKLIATMGFNGGNYTYIIEIKDINTTENPLIEKYIADGNGAKVLAEIPAQFKNILNNIKTTKNYTFTSTYFGANNVMKEDFVDRFIEDACYTTNNKQPSESIGYATYQDTLFSYVLDGNQIIPGEILVDSFGTPYKSLYESVYSLVNLDLFSMDSETNGNKLYIHDEKNLDILLQVTSRVSYRNYYSLLNEAYFEYINEDSLKIVVDYGTNGIAEGIISNIGTTQIPEISDYLASGKGPYVDTSATELNTVVEKFINAKSYKEDMGLNSSGAHIGYTYYMEHAVYVDYELSDYEDYGYIDYNGSIYEFSVSTNNGKETLNLGKIVKENSSLSETKIYPTVLSIFTNTSSLEYSVLNNYFMTTDVTLTGQVCDFMNMSDYKDTYIPYGAGLKVDYNEEDISKSSLYLGYFVTTSDGGYYRLENVYSDFDNISFDFIEEFLN